MFINDVGQSTWEEINDGIAGSNYGWTICEGDCPRRTRTFAIRYFNTDMTRAARLDAPSSAAPFTIRPSTNFRPATSANISLPTSAAAWIRVMDPSNNTASDFATGLSTPVDLQVGPDGEPLLSHARKWRSGLEDRRHSSPGVEHLLAFTGCDCRDNVMIGGFIITGTANKRVIVRALGPSLQQFNVPNPLADPILELHASRPGRSLPRTTIGETLRKLRSLTASWRRTNDLESAIIATLSPGAYTAIVRGQNGANRRRCGGSLRSRFGGRLEAGQYQHAQLCPDRRQQADRRIYPRKQRRRRQSDRASDRTFARRSLASAMRSPIPTLELRDSNGALASWPTTTGRTIPNQAAQITASGLRAD